MRIDSCAAKGHCSPHNRMSSTGSSECSSSCRLVIVRLRNPSCTTSEDVGNGKKCDNCCFEREEKQEARYYRNYYLAFLEDLLKVYAEDDICECRHAGCATVDDSFPSEWSKVQCSLQKPRCCVVVSSRSTLYFEKWETKLQEWDGYHRIGQGANAKVEGLVNASRLIIFCMDESTSFFPWRLYINSFFLLVAVDGEQDEEWRKWYASDKTFSLKELMISTSDNEGSRGQKQNPGTTLRFRVQERKMKKSMFLSMFSDSGTCENASNPSLLLSLKEGRHTRCSSSRQAHNYSHSTTTETPLSRPSELPPPSISSAGGVTESYESSNGINSPPNVDSAEDGDQKDHHRLHVVNDDGTGNNAKSALLTLASEGESSSSPLSSQVSHPRSSPTTPYPSVCHPSMPSQRKVKFQCDSVFHAHQRVYTEINLVHEKQITQGSKTDEVHMGAGGARPPLGDGADGETEWMPPGGLLCLTEVPAKRIPDRLCLMGTSEGSITMTYAQDDGSVVPCCYQCLHQRHVWSMCYDTSTHCVTTASSDKIGMVLEVVSSPSSPSVSTDRQEDDEMRRRQMESGNDVLKLSTCQKYHLSVNQIFDFGKEVYAAAAIQGTSFLGGARKCVRVYRPKLVDEDNSIGEEEEGEEGDEMERHSRPRHSTKGFTHHNAIEDRIPPWSQLDLCSTVNAMSVLPSHPFLVAGMGDGNVCLINAENLVTMTMYAHHREKVACVAAISSHIFVTGSYDHTMAVWDIRVPRQVWGASTVSTVGGCCFSSWGRDYASSSSGHYLDGCLHMQTCFNDFTVNISSGIPCSPVFPPRRCSPLSPSSLYRGGSSSFTSPLLRGLDLIVAEGTMLPKVMAQMRTNPPDVRAWRGSVTGLDSNGTLIAAAVEDELQVMDIRALPRSVVPYRTPKISRSRALLWDSRLVNVVKTASTDGFLRGFRIS